MDCLRYFPGICFIVTEDKVYLVSNESGMFFSIMKFLPLFCYL